MYRALERRTRKKRTWKNKIGKGPSLGFGTLSDGY
jgi:hypothetical protein